MLLSARTAAVLLALTAGPALAACPGPYPDPTAPAMTGEINLGAGTGTHPYPFTISTIGVGGFNLRDCDLEGEGLTGYDGDGLIDTRPGLVVHWRGGHPQLTITFENEADTLLLVSDPEGRWLFNDNAQDQNPQIIIPDPTPGDYAVFVGSHGSLSFTRPGMLTISGPSP